MNYQSIKVGDRRRTALIGDWDKWLRSADTLYHRFVDRVGCSPFDYHEVSSVGFLASASAIAGFLPMNEYDVFKKGRADKRTRVRGRADLWIDAGKYCYSFEVKRTRRPITAGYLAQRLTYAFDDVACVTNDEYNFAAACLAAVPTDEKREAACKQFAEHENVDFAYRIGPQQHGAYLFFQLKV